MNLRSRRPPLRLATAVAAFALVSACTVTGEGRHEVGVDPVTELPPSTALQDRSADSAARAAGGDG